MLVTLSTLLLASTAAAIAFPSEGETGRIPITRRALRITEADGKANITAIVQEAKRVVNKYQRNHNNMMANLGTDSRMLKVRGITPLSIPSELTWTGVISVGTPPKPFNIVFDTGSSDFTIPDAACTNCGTKARYSVASSSSGTNTGQTASASYADGSVTSGTVMTDVVVAGGLTIPKQSFISASSFGTTMVNSASDGMGMAFTSLSASGKLSVPFSIADLGLGKFFSVSLSNTAANSFVSFGSLPNISSAKQLAAKVVADATTGFYSYWQLAGGSALINGVTATTKRVNHIIDTGAVLISTPLADAATFWAAFPGSAPYPAQAGFYTYPCDSTVQVSFGMGARQAPLDINMSDFNLGYVDAGKTRCVGGLIGQNLPLGGSWLFGEVFIKNYYVVFDLQDYAITFITK